MTALEIIEKYIAFFEKSGHKRIPNDPLIPETLDCFIVQLLSLEVASSRRNRKSFSQF